MKINFDDHFNQQIQHFIQCQIKIFFLLKIFFIILNQKFYQIKFIQIHLVSFLFFYLKNIFFFVVVVLNNKDEQRNLDFSEKTLIIKNQLIQREQILEKYQQQINQVDQQLLLFNKSLQEDSSLHSSPSSYSSLYALELL